MQLSMSNIIKRDSNIELLRIISMFSILILHINGLGLNLPNEMSLIKGITYQGYLKLFIESLTIIGVNCFVLISGFYGIKPKIKNLLSLYIQCTFIAAFIYTIMYLIGYINISVKDIIKIFLPFSRGQWFITAYVGLYLISPILNKAISYFNKKEFIYSIILLTTLNIYFGWIYLNSVINSNGYNIMHFIYLYFIGRFINLNYNSKNSTFTKRSKSIYFFIYIFSSSLLTLFAINSLKFFGYEFMVQYSFAYNNPFVLISSISFFLFFLNITINNRVINWIASSVLAVLLIHNNSYIAPIFFKYINNLPDTYPNLFLCSLVISTIAIAIYIVCIIFDKFRLIITNPILSMTDRFIHNTLQNILKI